MGRRASYFWDKREQAYRTDTQGVTRYFRGVAREDHAAIAMAFAAHLETLASQAGPVEPDATDVCLAYIKASRGLASLTIRSHKERLTKFLGHVTKGGSSIGEKKASSLVAADLKAALREWEVAGLSDRYRAGICSSVKAAFTWAASEEGGRLIPTNPFREIRPPKCGRSPNRYASTEEVAAFLRFAWRRAGATPQAIARRDAARPWRVANGFEVAEARPTLRGPLTRRFLRLMIVMIRVGAHTGARPGDLCGAWWQDFDPAAGTITLPPDRHKTGHKTNRPLVLFLPPLLVRALVRERDRAGRHPTSMFTHLRGKGAIKRGIDAVAGEPWGKFLVKRGKPSFEDDSRPVGKAIRRLRAEAIAHQEARRAAAIARGVPEADAPKVTIQDRGHNRFVFYRLRHTVASDFLMRGGNSFTVATLLGTSPQLLDTTYGHMQAEFLATEATRLRSRKSAPESP